MTEERKPYPFKLYPFQCLHMRKEYKPTMQAPTLITCKDCGAILYMKLDNGQQLRAVEMRLK